MTVVKPRHPVSWSGAVTRIMGALGLAAAASVGRSDSLVRHWADPDGDREPNLTQAVALDAAYVLATGDAPPLLRVYEQLLADRTRGSVHQAQAPHARFLAVMSEVGEISTGLHQALADGSIRPHEARKVQQDVADAIERLSAMSRDLDALASGKVSERGGE